MRHKKNSAQCEAVLAAYRENPNGTLKELAIAAGLQSPSAVRYDLLKLTDQGVICWKPVVGRPDRAWRRTPPRAITRSQYAKKSLAGRMGKGVDALTPKPDNALEARIEAIVARDRERLGNGKDVVRDYPRSISRRVVRVG